MAEEPQPDPAPPSAPPSAPAADTEESQTTKPTSAEDRKTLAALSSLSTNNAQPEDATSGPKSAADQKALGELVSRLEIAGGRAGAGKGGEERKTEGKGVGSAAAAAEKSRKEEEEERRRKIKVDAGDVALLVEHLELSKPKATELLRSHDGDAVKAMRAYVQPVA